MSVFWEFNLLIIIGAVLMKVLVTKRWVAFRQLLGLSRIVVALVILLPLALPFFPKASLATPSAQIWYAPSQSAARNPTAEEGALTVGESRDFALPLGALDWLGALVLAFGLTVTFIRLTPAWFKLGHLRRQSYPLKRIGRVEIRVSDRLTVPLSFRAFSRAYVLLPHSLIERVGDYRLSVSHELQHHRQRDTIWVHALEVFRGLTILNPFSHLLVKVMAEIQEFACDETLLEREWISARAYGGCLLRVAETARQSRPVLVGTTGMAAGAAGSLLKRRIQMMVKKRRYPKSVGLLGAIMAVALMTTVAWASRSLIHDRRVTRAIAQSLLDDMRRGGGEFPVTINAEVVEQLNTFVGTPDGREYIKGSLARMANYRPFVESKLKEYGLPIEFLALPIIESGYQNPRQSPHPLHSAGLWQFTPGTARNFGLRVDDEVDERLNVEKATDGACRFLATLNLRFRDWELATMAYNMGERKVQRGIDETGSRNAWVLLQKGFTGDSHYLARMEAAALILRNPQILE
ncbi:MAG: transglycosylase SLT domain-containing protein [Deltaproteobacteria bacterium]|nr:transglycosylase SLT domain-containing protein [Deltaproteobacteria bacterium]MBI3293644.1 transglycosylase SLT domain-containing protein [Deltaproteobacteria bacterium]